MDNEKVMLSLKDIPQRWYNILPDLPEPLPPPLNPATGMPLIPEDFEYPDEKIKEALKILPKVL